MIEMYLVKTKFYSQNILQTILYFIFEVDLFILSNMLLRDILTCTPRVIMRQARIHKLVQVGKRRRIYPPVGEGKRDVRFGHV
jgi:hypothetical protein